MKKTKNKVMNKLEKSNCGISYNSLGKRERDAVELLKDDKKVCILKLSGEFYIVKTDKQEGV